MSTPVMLVDDLVNFIRQVVKDRPMENRNNEIAEVLVHDDELPSKRPNEADYPCVIVRFIYMENTIARVDIIGGVHSMQKGWRDVLNLLTPIQQALLKMPSVAKRHRMSKAHPMKFVLPPEQATPQYLAAIETYWEMPMVTLEQNKINAEMEAFLRGE
ncbi:hypothetical protein GCM10007425_12710 [Lysinibacillus alkalisoli]|uniref:Uncharacterized protein n=1 Tax=Lysinibacillus alkalisoli TaxID=1911548 RepID=A0A917G2P2_9BACI|nr:hypothetical protein [Lysinibacillus alkalisoli]GGG19750.1 hypothetical protein GCM10007425_12710 [Lysinibacillus alkalisoli]